MDIDPRRGAAFVAAIDAGSLEQAAALLHITPSAVSQRIAALEDDLGMPLLVRTRPCRPTAPGRRLLQFLRRRAMLEAEFMADLQAGTGPVKVALAVNNDTLATWLLPALAPILLAEQLLVEFVLDNQGHTFALLEQGRAVACIAGAAAPMRGCTVSPLGAMRYRMVAAPAYAHHYFPDGIDREAARHAPVMVFDHKDLLQKQFLLQHFSLQEGDYPFHFVPASDPFVHCHPRRPGLRHAAAGAVRRAAGIRRPGRPGAAFICGRAPVLACVADPAGAARAHGDAVDCSGAARAAANRVTCGQHATRCALGAAAPAVQCAFRGPCHKSRTGRS